MLNEIHWNIMSVTLLAYAPAICVLLWSMRHEAGKDLISFAVAGLVLTTIAVGLIYILPTFMMIALIFGVINHINETRVKRRYEVKNV